MQKERANMPLPFKSKSQSLQDVFAFQVCGANNTYIEIGGNHPVKKNNTFNLEELHSWKGYSIEFDYKWKKDWDTSSRQNPCYFQDALNTDYEKYNIDLNLPMHIGYLSCDIEPPKNTYSALVKVIEQGVTFDCITFEHDAYKSGDDYNKLATEFLTNHGYKVAVKNVYHKNNTERFFETWYVRAGTNFPTIEYHEWKKSFEH
jgi:hypothetical protein